MTRVANTMRVVLPLASVLVLGMTAPTGGAEPVPAHLTAMHRVLAPFDDCRALAMRGLKQAQDLKTVYLYGRGFGLDMPESVPEDWVVEGLWLFDYLEAMDVTSMSLVSYAAAAEHPNFQQELKAFQAFVPGAAKKTLAYYDKTARALADARRKVNAAAQAKSPFKIQTLPRNPVSKSANERIAGDGFRVGWGWQVNAGDASGVARYCRQHGYDPDRVLEIARKYGVDYLRPQVRDLFAWRKGNGPFEFEAADASLGRFKKYGLAIWLPAPADAAYVPHVQAAIRHVRDRGVPIVAVEVVGKDVPPLPAAEKRAWLEKNRLAPAEPKTQAERRCAVADDIRWREREHVAYFRPMVEGIRKAAPDLPIVLHRAPPHEGSVVRNGWNDELLTRELGVMPYGRSEENLWDELRRTHSDVHFAAAETHSASGNAFAQYSFSGYVHGALAIHTGVGPMLRGFYPWMDCYLYPDFRPRWSTLLDWRRFHERAQSMAPEMRHTIPTPQTAILWSHTSDIYQSFTRDFVGGSYGFKMGPANYHRVGSVGWDRLLNMINLPHDYVTEAQAVAGALERYELVILPAAQALPEAVAEAVRKYVRGGGKVIATSSVGLVNEKMQTKGAGQLADVFGADFAKFTGPAVVAGAALKSPSGHEALFEHWAGAGVFDKPVVRPKRAVYCTFKPRPGAKVLAEYTDGAPAVLLNAFGKGQAAVIGYPVGKEFFITDTYHMHYGHNWSDWPHGSMFQVGVCLYIENLLDKMKVRPDVVVSYEHAPRPIGQDAGWPAWFWTRKGGGYRDFVWKKSSLRGTTAPLLWGYSQPRSVEVALRARQGNPNRYLTVYNREGAYGFDPGVVHFAAISKLLKIEMRRKDGRHVYDLAVGSAVPVKIEQGATTFETTIEPAMGRMFVVATGEDDTIRLYEGRRTRGGPDADLRKSVAACLPARRAAARGEDAPPSSVVVGPKDIAAFLGQRAEKGITIGCESPMWVASARKLAAALKAKYGKKVRITRNSPRIQGSFNGLGTWRSELHTFVERPDVILGNRTESHYVAALCIPPHARPDRREDQHDAPLPIVTTHSFPGPGRCAVVLTRPYIKELARDPKVVFTEKPARWRGLVIGGSDAAGVEAGVAEVIKLLK